MVFNRIQTFLRVPIIDKRWINVFYEGHFKATCLLPVSAQRHHHLEWEWSARASALNAHAFESRMWPAPCRSALPITFFKKTSRMMNLTEPIENKILISLDIPS